MKSKRSEKTNGLTRREFVQSSSRVGATVAGAAFISSLPRGRAIAASRVVSASEVTSGTGAVATELEEVARVGAGIVERDGNAMDAAAAACLAGCIMQPHLSDLGGYVCCAVVLEARADRVWSLDSNSVAPATAHERMYKVLPLAEGPRDINENDAGSKTTPMYTVRWQWESPEPWAESAGSGSAGGA
jgi:Gamma-glutamyltranspeptidase